MRLFRLLICAGLIVSGPCVSGAGQSVRHPARHQFRQRRDASAAARVPCEVSFADPGGPPRRCAAARAAFERQNPCPLTGRSQGPCPGYVVDHIVPLKHGGADDPSNMQWQTIADAKAKDRIE